MKKILIFAPDSSHTAKFLDMIHGNVNYFLVADDTGLNVKFKQEYKKINQHSLSGVLTILKFLLFSKYDYIHVHTINFTALIVALFACKPIIVTSWGSDVLLVPKRSFIHKKIAQFVIKRARIVNSANDACNINAAVRELVPGTDIKGLHFAVSPLSKPAPISKKKNIIYSPRGHSDLYNIDKIIEAFRDFSPSHPDWKLVVAGVEHPINTPKLKKQAEGLPVIFSRFCKSRRKRKIQC